MVQVVEHLHSNCKTLSSNLGLPKKKTKRKKEKKRKKISVENLTKRQDQIEDKIPGSEAKTHELKHSQ
jgi:hypothetical protein